MLVDCPDCGRSYRLDAADLGPHGRVVICPRCDARWFQRGATDGRAEAAIWSRVRTTDRQLQPAGQGYRSGGDRPAEEAFDAKALAAGRPAPSSAVLRRLRLGAVALTVAAVATAGLGARAAVVRAVPRTASLYAAIGWPVNLRGLRFAHIAPVRTDGSPADVTVGGEIRNVAHGRIVLPRLVFEVRDAEGATLVRWSESAPAATLPAGRTLAFASRPQRMPAEGRTVLVRFEDPLPGDGMPPARQRVVSR